MSCSAPTSSPDSPTETEEMFARSLDLVDACGLTHLHVFPFSPRPGTPGRAHAQLKREVIKDRARRPAAKKGKAALRGHLERKWVPGARCWSNLPNSGAPSILTRCTPCSAHAEPGMILGMSPSPAMTACNS